MLPYATLQAAEAAVGGRPLTAAEALWFRYTASVPDPWLYNLNVVFLFIIFNVVPVPSLFLDLLARFSFPSLRRFKIQPSSFCTLSAVLHCYKTVMLTFLLVVGPLQLSSYPLIKFIGIRTSLPLPSVWEILVQLTVYFIIEDYGNYWIHRWLHSEWAFNNIHYMHHEFVAPTGLAAPYSHWLETLVLGLPSFIGPALVPGHMVTFWLWIGLRQIEAIDTHSGFRTKFDHVLSGMSFPGHQQSLSHSMVVRSTMTTTILSVAKVRAILHPYLHIVIIYMEPTRVIVTREGFKVV